MKFKNTMLVVEDINKSKGFYQRVLGLKVKFDLGENVTLDGNLALQSKHFWTQSIINKPDDFVTYGGNNAELYFEEKNIDEFIKRLNTFDDIEYVHPLREQIWGQKSVHFYDPDKHIIEVAEPMTDVLDRFFQQGLSVNDIAEKTFMPVKILKTYRIISKVKRLFK